MEEERLIHLLRGLPREAAPADFTARVLSRLEAPAAAGARGGAGARRRGLSPQQWHRLMLTTATAAALSLSVVVSVGLLQPGRPAAAPALAVPTTSTAPALPAGAARMTAAAAAPALARQSFGPARPLRSLRQGGTAAASFDAARAHQLLREMQLESVQIARELRQLRRAGGAAPPAVVYLGGDESVDLVLSTGRARTQGPSLADRDGGDNHELLD